MAMKNAGIILLGLCVGVIGATFYFLKISPEQKKESYTTPSPAPSFSVAVPPSDSLQGTITARSGSIQWESRTATVPSELTSNVSIKKGELIETRDTGTVAIHFNHMGTIALAQKSSISFIQTLPTEFVAAQSKGTGMYTVDGTTPLSVRIRTALLRKTEGAMKITMTEGDPQIRITTDQGTAQIAFNDQDSVSQVFTLREGQTYIYNSEERTAMNLKNL
jgi:hypothetical protein